MDILKQLASMVFEVAVDFAPSKYIVKNEIILRIYLLFISTLLQLEPWKKIAFDQICFFVSAIENSYINNFFLSNVSNIH